MKENKLIHILEFTILFLSCVFAYSIRLFPIVENGPTIHEYDPHFNWRCARYAYEHGFRSFLDWFDNISWYPQGRAVGVTSYPGMMFTSVFVKNSLNFLHIFVDLQDVCIYTGPVSSVATAILSFMVGKLVKKQSSTLCCLFAALTSFVPGLLSKSVAGSYDYECFALFLLVLCLYSFAVALNHGSILYALLSALAYGAMCWTWGGYVFVSNCIPLFVLGLLSLGLFSWRLYISYTVWAVVGTIFSYAVPFIDDKLFKKPEHFLIYVIFILVQMWGLFTLLRYCTKKESYNSIVVASIMILPLFVLIFITLSLSTGLISGFSGRLMQMFDPAYASKHIPIIASVAEHQTTSWGSYFYNCGVIVIFLPVGCYFILKQGINHKTEPQFLLVIFALSTLYFAAIMVRLLSIFSLALVYVVGIGIEEILRASFALIKYKGTKYDKLPDEERKCSNEPKSNIKELKHIDINEGKLTEYQNNEKQLKDEEINEDNLKESQENEEQLKETEINPDNSKESQENEEAAIDHEINNENLSQTNLTEQTILEPKSKRRKKKKTPKINRKYHRSKWFAFMFIFITFIIILQLLIQSVFFADYSMSDDMITFPVKSFGFKSEKSDDYREGYRWLFTNTHQNDRVMSWWDYGYQITSLGNRGCMADGNTNNFTHIGIIGMTMASPEDISWRLARLLGADYMLVIFGGASGYDSDDINKFLWMPKIANQTFTNISGAMYYPYHRGSIVSESMSNNMTLSMMFKFCYNNFKRFCIHPRLPSGFDIDRSIEVPHLNFKITNFEEAFTSKHWIVRIYRVKKDPLWNRVY